MLIGFRVMKFDSKIFLYMVLKASLFFLQLKNLLNIGLPPSSEVFKALSLSGSP